ncbi:MAG TPA: flagellar protein export ATPase FliI [Candidatus Acidoferrales bacterium]|nr:flagellar protein export ATPase FliI [Candidatus Acidoferrales bacterium]HTX57785.1 flagellar protein export ATPase FliI [Candidatus Acidoferrales bacterium]
MEATVFSAEPYLEALRGADLVRQYGKVRQVIGVVIESLGPNMAVGETCFITYKRNAEPVLAEVVGFRDNKVLIMPLGELMGIGAGSDVVALGAPLEIGVTDHLLGRVLGGLGRPIDGQGTIVAETRAVVTASPPPPLSRRRITEPLSLGIRAIDGMLTCGKGQRVGIFAGSGVGKSTILGMIARNTAADVNVIALVGERGKEVRDFIERDLGEEGLRRSVVVVSTSDQPALVRIKAAFVAMTIAEYFRDQGLDVMFMMDSVTRFAMAQREVGLAIGEPTTTRGYTPSVFALLPKLLERAGTSERGTITGLFAVLVDGDDMMEPVADAVRSILDGHIVLSRQLSSANHYPAIDVLQSVSRVMPDVVDANHYSGASAIRDMLATYKDAEDLINIGAYVPGSNPRVDLALSKIEGIRHFLRQGIYETSSFEQTFAKLMSVT